jgi:uncharacterized damage-inducible protein DinB
MAAKHAPIEIVDGWSGVNDHLIELLDLVPVDKLDFSPKPELWNFKGLFIHICVGRYGLMEGIVKDGIESPNVLAEGQAKDGLRQLLTASWERMEPFLRDSIAVNREYELDFPGGESVRYSGHWLVFSQIEHDIHHRADILHYLRELGIEHEEPDAIMRRLRERDTSTAH